MAVSTGDKFLCPFLAGPLAFHLMFTVPHIQVYLSASGGGGGTPSRFSEPSRYLENLERLGEINRADKCSRRELPKVLMA